MNIYESMNAVMVDCGFVGKDSKNQQQGYKFRGIDAVMNALNPALRKNKVFVVPTVISQEREERTTAKGGLLIYSIVTCKYTFYAEDGSSVEAVVIGEGMDSGDKATNKAMSAAFKYACFQAFCIPTEEMKDSEDDSPEPVPLQYQPSDKVTSTHWNELMKELIAKKISPNWVLSQYELKDPREMTFEVFWAIKTDMKSLKKDYDRFVEESKAAKETKDAG